MYLYIETCWRPVTLHVGPNQQHIMRRFELPPSMEQALSERLRRFAIRTNWRTTRPILTASVTMHIAHGKIPTGTSSLRLKWWYLVGKHWVYDIGQRPDRGRNRQVQGDHWRLRMEPRRQTWTKAGAILSAGKLSALWPGSKINPAKGRSARRPRLAMDGYRSLTTVTHPPQPRVPGHPFDARAALQFDRS